MERHQDDPFVLLGINTDSSKDEYRKKAQELGVTWRSAWQGSTNGPIPTQWRVQGYPTKFVLDAEGRIRHTFAGVRKAELEKVVDELIAEEKARQEAGGR